MPRRPIELSSDILDYIFAFLRCDIGSLRACSEAHPGLSTIVERHLYYYIIITVSPDFDTTGHGYPFRPPELIKLISETPRVINHVRVLQVAFRGHSKQDSRIYQKIALILPKFCKLRTIFLTSQHHTVWGQLPKPLKTAVECCLRLPALHNVSIGISWFPLSILDNNPNIDCLSISERPEIPHFREDALQPKSLIIIDVIANSFWSWVKRHTIKLRSLQCIYAHMSEREILGALEKCSGTLNDLDLKIHSPYETTYYLGTRKPVSYSATPPTPLINISSLPLLQHITLRIAVYHDNDSEYSDSEDGFELCKSGLPSAVEILKTASSLQWVTFEILIDDIHVWHSIDFSSLAALAESTFFRHLDFYCLGVSHPIILSKLADYESLKKWIEEGVLVIHAGEAAPGNSQLVY